MAEAKTTIPVTMRERNALRPQKTAILLAQRIVAEISDGGLAPGTLLLPEREMLQRYGVARGTLREALRFLEIQGVLTIKPGPAGGPTVNMPDPRSLASAIALLLQLSDAPFSAIVEARQVFEPALAAFTARRAGADELERVRESVEAMERALGDHQAFLVENQVFHDLIAGASGNALFSLLLRSLAWITDATVLGVEYDAKRRQGILDAHRAIYEALAERDEVKAEAAMKRHMDEFARYLKRHYPRVLDRTVRWDDSVG
jgi:GntR family transcriptional repressor for pyruvate dehydrogenase complex